LPKIDAKKKFIQLANQIAHGNSVLLKTTMGSVSLVEQAIINDMHDLGMIAPDRKRKLREQHISELIEAELGEGDDDEGGPAPVVGAYVANPKIGIHHEVACADINSLYPNAIRALNMSVETIFGQLRPDETKAYIAARVAELGPKKRAEAWDGLFHCLEYGHVMARDDTEITLDLEDGTSRVMTGAKLYDYIFTPSNHLCMTANGTLFRTDRDGLIPMLLGKWYAERQGMQYREKSYTDISTGLPIPEDLEAEMTSRLQDALAREDTSDLNILDLLKARDVERLCMYVRDNNLAIVDGKIVPANPESEKKIKSLETFWNQRQQARKILLNSLYGALLNEACRFYDSRLGQSTTLNGRMIVRHMNAKVNEVITGHYDHKGEAIVYADTDSCYFSAYNLWKDDPDLKFNFESREATIALYNEIAAVVNESFPEFMMRTFNCSHERGSKIKAGRELVASSALFIKKKKYACLMYDKDDKRLDVKGKPGKLKAMGLDLKRADTPKYMQQFLEKLLMDLLTGAEQEKMYEDIKQFRKEFIARPGWEKGTPKKVNALTAHTETVRKRGTAALTTGVDTKAKRAVVPPHVQAAINYNELRKFNNDRYSMEITDGSKVVVCKLRSNVYNMLTVAYPIDEPHLPQWYKDLPFDHALMEETIIDAKLNNLVGVLDWDLSKTKERDADDVFVFG
jgi:DNA polymerase elongation subunit (family B)